MSAPLLNQQWRLAARPEALPDRSHWSWTEQAVEPLQAGEVLVEVQYVSLDPAMRGWMNAGRSYIDGVEVGDVMRAAAGGRVVESSFDGISAGQSVVGLLGVQRYAVVDGRRLLVADLKMAPLAKRVGGHTPRRSQK